jgi:signal peptidase I
MLIIIGLILSGCQDAVLRDPFTKKEIAFMKPSEGMTLIRIMNDSMLGVSDYSTDQLVIDPNAYRDTAIRRGEVVYFYNPLFKKSTDTNYHLEEKEILRVVALSGERIRMKKGQIYINDKRLDTFYGKDYNNNVDVLRKELLNPKLDDYEIENIKNRLRFVENENMSEILVPEGTIFLMGDNRSRASDSVLLGPIPAKSVIGKVIGKA